MVVVVGGGGGGPRQECKPGHDINFKQYASSVFAKMTKILKMEERRGGGGGGWYGNTSLLSTYLIIGN